MTHLEFQMKECIRLREMVKQKAPLIHFLTNAISMNDCANVILGLGGKPIMAEHPLEVEEITSVSGALAVNLGNISDSRMVAMRRSSLLAHRKQIPWCIDVVGTGCSSLRRTYAKALIEAAHPSVIKGNMSELKAISKLESHACGIDVGEKDLVTSEHLKEDAHFLMALAQETDAVIMATGVIDLVANASACYALYNGCEMLSKLTGTGCMIGGMVATYLSVGSPLESSLLAALMMGIAGEACVNAKGNGSFRVALLDALYSMADETLLRQMRCEQVC